MSDPTPATSSTATQTTAEALGGTLLTATASKVVKPGYKTTEFWLSLAAKIVGFLMTTGIIADGSPLMRSLGLAAMVLSSFGYTVARGLAKGGTAVLLFVLLTSSSSTACSGSAREARLRDAAKVLVVASDAFVAFDAAHQQAIVDKATSMADGTAKLEAYRASRLRVVELFAGAYHALAAAALISSDNKSLVNALFATELALKAWAELKGGGT